MKTRGVLAILIAVVLIILVIVLALVTGSAPAVTGGAARRKAAALVWDGPRACLPPPMVAECLKAVRGVPGFGPVSGEERARLAAAAARLSAKYRAPVSGEQLVGIRNQEAALAAGRAGTRAQRYGEEIAAAYAAGDSVLTIAARHGLPPLAALRQILVEGGHSEAQVRAMVADPARLPPRLAREAPAVFEADLGSRLNADRIRAKSAAYEDAVGAHLRARGLGFKTENDLRAEHAARRDTTPLMTPDFLFTQPVTIDGRRVAWLDAKDFMAYDGKLVAKSLARQAAKYTARFGPGAFVFSGGLMCDSKTARLGALVLDGSHIV